MHSTIRIIIPTQILPNNNHHSSIRGRFKGTATPFCCAGIILCLVFLPTICLNTSKSFSGKTIPCKRFNNTFCSGEQRGGGGGRMGNLGYIIGGPRGLNMGGRKGIICMRKMVTKKRRERRDLKTKTYPRTRRYIHRHITILTR